MADLTSSANNRQFDLDSGGGTDFVDATVISVAASGGALQVGGLSAPADASALGVSLFTIGAVALYNGTTYDRQRSLDSIRTASSSPSVGIPAVVLADRRYTNQTLGTVVGNATVWDVDGAAEFLFFTASGTTGTFVFEVSYDGTTYQQAITWRWNGSTHTDVSSSAGLTVVSGVEYRVQTAGWRFVHARTVTTLGTTTAISATASSNSTLSMLNGDIPHDGVDAGNPLKIGGYGSNTVPAQTSADADRVNAWLDRRGRLAAFVVGNGGSSGSDGTQVGGWQVPGATSEAGQQVPMPMGSYVLGAGVSWDRVRAAAGVTGSVSIGGPTASDAVLAVAPVTVGGRASNAAPTAMSADGDVVDARFTRTGALNVYMVDQAGAAASIGGGTQYVEDVALGVVGSATGTLAIARASTAAPTTVSADADAVGLWASRQGVLATMLSSGSGTLVGVSAETTTNVLAVGGGVAHAATDAGNPLKVGGFASSTSPTAVTTGQRVNAWFALNGVQYVSLADSSGGTVGTSNFAGDNGSVSNAISANARLIAFNGVGYDRVRDTSSARTSVNADNPGYLAIGEVDAETNFTSAITPWRDKVVGERHTVLVDMLSESVRADFWTTTTASGGTATTATGETTLATSAATSGSVQITSQQNVALLPGEEYEFSIIARTSDTGVANNIRRWGLYTVSGTTPQDGWYFELTGTTLNAVSAKAATPTAVASGSWSRFSSQPFTLDTNYHRYVIRVTDDYVVFMIDGIARHILALNPSTSRTATLVTPITMHSTNTTAATNETLVVRGVAVTRFGVTASIDELQAAPNRVGNTRVMGVGPGFDIKVDPAGIVATSTSNAITIPVNGADVITFHVTTIGTTPGSMIVEYSGDDSVWATHGSVLKLGAESWIQGAFVPAVNDVYMVRTTGLRKVRVRVNAVYASGSFTAKFTSSSGPAMVKAIDVAPAPHNIGYAPTGISATFSTAQTSTTIGPTVSATQRLVVTYVQIQSAGTTAGTAVLYYGTGAFSRGTSKPIFDGEWAPSATLKPGFAASPPVPWIGVADEELKLTTTNAQTITVTIWYYLVAA